MALGDTREHLQDHLCSDISHHVLVWITAQNQLLPQQSVAMAKCILTLGLLGLFVFVPLGALGRPPRPAQPPQSWQAQQPRPVSFVFNRTLLQDAWAKRNGTLEPVPIAEPTVGGRDGAAVVSESQHGA